MRGVGGDNLEDLDQTDTAVAGAELKAFADFDRVSRGRERPFQSRVRSCCDDGCDDIDSHVRGNDLVVGPEVAYDILHSAPRSKGSS